MIFLTVGTQLPFDRLVKTMDQWCKDNPAEEVFGQIAEPGPNGYKPENFEWQPFIDPTEFVKKYEQAEMIVAHAGMGAIITALTKSKPIIIIPRRAENAEHRNDHQMATANRFKDRANISVAFNENELPSLLNCVRQKTNSTTFEKASEFAEDRLILSLRDFIWDQRTYQ